MNYELSKKLGDAGYTNYSKCWSGIEDLPNPTLSELIEACGDRFDLLERVEDDEMSAKAPRDEVNNRIKGGWEASSLDDIRGYKWEYGSTPEEAVANLWLALNRPHDLASIVDNGTTDVYIDTLPDWKCTKEGCTTSVLHTHGKFDVGV